MTTAATTAATEQGSYFEHIAEKAELLATKAELQATKVELQDTKAKLQDTKVKQDDGVDTKAKQQDTKLQDEFDQKSKPPTKKRKVEIPRSNGGDLLWNWSLCECGEYNPSDQDKVLSCLLGYNKLNLPPPCCGDSKTPRLLTSSSSCSAEQPDTKAELLATKAELHTKAELQGDKEGEPQNTKATKAELQATIRLLQATKAELHKCIRYRVFPSTVFAAVDQAIKLIDSSSL